MPSNNQANGEGRAGRGDRALIEVAMRAAIAVVEHASSTGASDEPPFQPPSSDSLPGYDITREIHRGGQGVVYQATQKNTRRRVAIKVMREGPFASPRERARFEREVHILSQLNHPNIVAVHDSGEASGHSYFVMDYISGNRLDTYMAGAERSVEDTLRLFIKVCNAVNVAHLRGIIHRDLKPGNIRVDAAGEPHILDFGLAKVSSYDVLADSRPDVMTITGQFVGSLPWASPEQAEGAPAKIDVRTDVYSLGVILFQMLTARFPYDVIGNMRDVLGNIMTAEPFRPSSIRRQLNDELDTIVLKCLCKERDRRYQSAGELARDIERYLRGDPIDAKRDSGWYVARKLLARHRKPALAVAAFALLLTGSAIALAVLYQRAEFQAGIAHDKQLEAERLTEVARQENIEAQRQSAIALAVNDFLNHDLLTAVDPIQGGGREITVREVLDRSAGKIGDRFADERLVEASVRATISNAYKGLGKYDLALEQAEPVLAIRRELLGDEHPDTLAALHHVGELYEKLARLAEAEPVYLRSLELHRRIKGEDDETTLKAMNNLGMLYSKQGRYPESETFMREALTRAERALGRDDDTTLTIATNLGQVLDSTGRADESLPIYQRTLEARRRVLGPDHPDTLTVMNNLAGLHARERRWTEAETVYRETLKAQQRVLGEEHPYTLATMNNLAMLFWRQQRVDEAESLWLRTHELQSKALGSSHPSTLNSLASIALIRKRQKRFDEADQMYHEVLKGQLAALGADHPATLITQGSLAMLAMDTGRLDDAAAIFNELVERRTRLFGANHAGTLTDRNNLAAIESRRGNAASAESHFVAVIDTRQRTLGPDHADTLLSRNQLAKLYTTQARHAEAAGQLTIVVEGLRRTLAADDPRLASALLALGVSLKEQARFAEAEPILIETFQAVSQNSKAPAAARRDSIRALIDLYTAWDKPDTVQQWRERMPEGAER